MRKYFLKSWFGTQDTRSTGSVVSGLLVRGHWPTGEGQVLFSQEEGNPVLSACAETNRVLEWSSRHFLSVRLEPASAPLWSCCLFHGVDLYFKIDEAEKICTVQILLSLICISSLTRQLTGHLLVCVGFFFLHLLRVSESGTFFAPSLSAPVCYLKFFKLSIWHPLWS